VTFYIWQNACYIVFIKRNSLLVSSTQKIPFHPSEKKNMPKHLTSAQRANIVYARERGETLEEIATHLGCGRTTVGDTLRRLEATGTTSPRKHPGKRKIFNPQAQESLKRLVKKDTNRRLTAGQIQVLWEKKTGKTTSVKTIRRALRDVGLRSCVARRKPLLTTNHMENRLEWARQHQHWTTHEWRRVLWSDESPFLQFQNNRLCRVWREPDEEFALPCLSATVKHSPSRMFWGCFSYQGLGPLVALHGHVTGESHAKTLRRHAFPTMRKFFPRGDGIFQEDNAPPHTSKIATATRVGSGLQFLPWPAQSPDLNPIENLWHDVKTRLYERKKKPKNLPELERAVKAAWKSIPPERIQALVDSMPRRIQLCIAAQGAPIQY
jgi:transposase